MEPLTRYVKVGLTHNSLYPFKDNPKRHEESLAVLLDRDDIEAVDLTIPYGEPYRSRSIKRVISSGKTTIYNGYLLPTGKIPLGTLSSTEQAQILILGKEQADIALEIGSLFFMQSTGADPGELKRTHAFESLAMYIQELSHHIKQKRNMPFLIELMDRDMDKCSLCGPTQEVVEFLDRLSLSVPDVGVVVDVSHIPLMKETFAYTIQKSSKYTKHVHLGNCIVKDRNHPMWGDKHPAIGMPGSEVDIPQVAEVLQLLWDTGYLNSKNRPVISLEITAAPGKTIEETVTDNLSRLYRAWDMIKRN